MEKNYGVYICKGCGIADILDVEAVASEAAGNTRTPAEKIKSHDVLCGPEGLEMIRADIKEGVNAITIAACSPRVKYEEFHFPGIITERVNIRELCAWSQEKPTEETPEE